MKEDIHKKTLFLQKQGQGLFLRSVHSGGSVDERIYNLSPFENRSSILNHSYIVDKKLHEVGDFIKNMLHN